ncbi:hypothetical protein [Streptosporangium amethystogenes]|uniref:hypothetical protein n=1 Tax=Streptosporangium amethystogenes TaxID=2002 RepID=UPI0012F7E704|nr:hypothetical protein [Streptosporangium amethystogenes]
MVVRLLPADVDRERFREAMEPLREMSAFCTAQVLDSGVDGDRPYIVSEYVDGPTLQEVVTSEGVLGALPDDLRGLITACLAKDPARRPGASDALLRLVGEFLTSDLISPRPPHARPPSTGPARRPRTLPLVAGALAVFSSAPAGAKAAQESANHGGRRPPGTTRDFVSPDRRQGVRDSHLKRSPARQRFRCLRRATEKPVQTQMTLTCHRRLVIFAQWSNYAP